MPQDIYAFVTYDGSSGEELGSPSGRKNLHGKGGTEDNSRAFIFT